MRLLICQLPKLIERSHGVELFDPHKKAERREAGVLPSQEIKELVATGKISSVVDVTEDQIQPASIDLRLGRKAYEVVASFLPSAKSLIMPKISEILIQELDLSKPTVLEPHKVYVAPVMEFLYLPPEIGGAANPKSTTGRLDVFTRLMTEGQSEFESVAKGYCGDLYVEIVPRSFPIIVRSGTTLNQLRLFRGNPEISSEQLRKLAQKRPIAYEGNGAAKKPVLHDGTYRVSLNLSGIGGDVVAYRAKNTPTPVDLARIRAYDVLDFWDPLTVQMLNGSLVLKPGEFYILASKETVSVPPEYAAEMVAYDQSMGEFTVHYAGFFDPGFGSGPNGEIKGTSAVLEVRAHEVPILLEDGRLVGALSYLKMAERPEKIYGQNIGSSYQGQALALSKQFKTLVHSVLASPELALTT